MSFRVYPAIDVRDGRVVRLQQGDYARETRYGDDPQALAARYAADGAAWLHLVDLDAARAGGYTLAPLLQRIVQTTGLAVQTGGGVRSADDIQRLLDAGARRVVVGSLAVREPDRVIDWIARFGAEQITVALDTRQDSEGVWTLPVHGWTESGGAVLDAVAERYAQAGLRHLLCTDIGRDGMLSGANAALYARMRARWPMLQVQASGGVGALDDVVAVRGVGCAGVVLGRALLEGRFQLSGALALERAEDAPC